MAILDWIIMIGFFFCLIGIVLWVVKHKKDDTSDYFLSGRSETWLAVGAAVFAANIGSEKIFSMSMATPASRCKKSFLHELERIDKAITPKNRIIFFIFIFI